MRRALGPVSVCFFVAGALLLIGALSHLIWQSPADEIVGRLHGALEFTMLGLLARLNARG